MIALASVYVYRGRQLLQHSLLPNHCEYQITANKQNMADRGDEDDVESKTNDEVGENKGNREISGVNRG